MNRGEILVSVITVINKPEVYRSMLYKSITAQKGIEFEIIEIDNMNNDFDSLIDAYRNGLQRSTGNWLLFVHPDVSFNSDYSLLDFMQKAYKSLEENPQICLWGVAGSVKSENHNVVTIIEQGVNRERRNVGFSGRDYVEVQTVDACCYIIRRSDLLNIGFSDYLTGYHMVVEDLCLKMQEKGKLVVVLPIDLWHLSPGNSLDYTYYRETRKLLIHHREIKSLNTTSFRWDNTLKTLLKLKYYEIRNYVHHLF